MTFYYMGQSTDFVCTDTGFTRKRLTITTKFEMYFTGKKWFEFTFNSNDGSLACTGRRQVLIDENTVVH